MSDGDRDKPLSEIKFNQFGRSTSMHVRSASIVATIAIVAAASFAIGAGLGHATEPLVPLRQPGIVYTADETGNSISAIDLGSGKIVTVPVRISPHNVQVTADGSQLLAVGEPAADNHGHGASAAGHGATNAAGRLLVFASGKLAAGPAISIEVGAHPAHVITDRSGKRAFVTLAGDNAVAVVDLVRKSVIRTVRTGRYPHGLRMSPDGRELYVANVQDGSVSVIDLSSLAEVARIPVGRAPVQVGFTPDGTRVYVSLRDDNSVAVVDTAARAKIAAIGVGEGPIQVHATPDGRSVYVANQGSETKPGDTVSVIDVASGGVVDTIRTGKGAHGVAVSTDGGLAFISNIADSTVSVIDTATRSVAATYRVGRGPNGITFASGRAP